MKTTKTKIEPITHLGEGMYCEDEIDGGLRIFNKPITRDIWLDKDQLKALVEFARQRGYQV